MTSSARDVTAPGGAVDAKGGPVGGATDVIGGPVGGATDLTG